MKTPLKGDRLGIHNIEAFSVDLVGMIVDNKD
jgi:hypothetical protein